MRILWYYQNCGLKDASLAYLACAPAPPLPLPPPSLLSMTSIHTCHRSQHKISHKDSDLNSQYGIGDMSCRKTEGIKTLCHEFVHNWNSESENLSTGNLFHTFQKHVLWAWTYHGFPTRVVYLKHDIKHRYTILVGNPWHLPCTQPLFCYLSRW